MTEGAMAAFLANIGEFFTTATGWLGNVLDIIVENPALTVVCLAMPIVGFSVGLLNRLFRIN